MSRLIITVIGLLFGFCLASGLAAQADDPPPQPTSTLLIRIKSTRISLDQAEQFASELQRRKTRARLQASKILRDHFLRHRKAFRKLMARTSLKIEKLAAKGQKTLLGKQGSTDVEKLRTEALATSRSSNLSKQMIQSEIDPRLKELRQLLHPNLSQVLAEDEKIEDAIEDLHEKHADLREWFAIYASMTAGLELHEDTTKHFAKYPFPEDPGTANRLDESIEFMAFTGLPMTPSDRKALLENRSLQDETPYEEYLGTLELNRIRHLLGLSLVRIDTKLSDAARDHSKDMHTLGFFSHTSPVEGKQRFSTRASNFGTSAGSENIAAGRRQGKGAITSWWYSPGHHRNMLGNHRRTGLGQYESMWTQMFGG
jgi:hypothetical protein